MIKTRKFYFLPFLDNLTAVCVTLLLLLIFKKQYSNLFFGTVATIFMIFILCGRIYVRMWHLSRKNTRYNYGLTQNNFVGFILPLVIFDLVIVIFYCLCEFDIIPLKNIIVSSFYTFPDNAPRELVNISVFDYIFPFIRIWFGYMFYITKNGLVLFLAPILSFISAILGYKLGDKNIQLANPFKKNKTNE